MARGALRAAQSMVTIWKRRGMSLGLKVRFPWLFPQPRKTTMTSRNVSMLPKNVAILEWS